MYNGQKYVRDDHRWEPSWKKVEPIKWIIKNWEDMPKQINPKGSGKASAIEINSEEAIACLPFYPNENDLNGNTWQNSTIRGYLNGINVNDIKENGNVNYTAPNGGDFTKQNFITEALQVDVPSLSKRKAVSNKPENEKQ